MTKLCFVCKSPVTQPMSNVYEWKCPKCGPVRIVVSVVDVKRIQNDTRNLL